MADDAGEDQRHLLVIRPVRSVSAVHDPITPEQKAQFRAEIQDLLDSYGARVINS